MLVNNVNLEGLSVLDVGSGLGDLLGFLQDNEISLAYTGVDVTPGMVEQARKNYPAGNFLCADIFGPQNPFAPASFDVVFCSGTLNLNLGNNIQFMPHALSSMFSLCRQTLVLNLLHHRCAWDDEDDTYFYHDPEMIMRLAQNMGCDVRLIDDYLPNDFTIICNRLPE